MDRDDIVKSILLDLHKDMGYVKNHMATLTAEQTAIKDDLREHMRRTNLLEKEQQKIRDELSRTQGMAKGASAVVGVVITLVVTALKYYDKI